MNQHHLLPDNEYSKSTDRYLPKKEVIHITGLSKSTIYSLIKQGIFPAQIKLGMRRVGWLQSEVTDWLENRKTHSRVGASKC